MERRDSALDVVLVADKDQPRPELTRGLAPAPTATTTCLLDRLPDELLLIIWEYAVIDAEPLLVNCPCDSFFGGWTDAYYSERDAWKEGTRQPPCQPPLTRVCRSIRADALSIFYSRNAFRAGYCYECDTNLVVSWLRVIGQQNRSMLKEFFFWDANAVHDQYSPKCLKKLKRSAVVRELGGCVDTIATSDACRHDVRFGQEPLEELEGVADLFEEVL
ncbi:hypothetical protein CERZMDRAFT_91615 [Cercospora zeae-maydis SCOH1-5]|uniref:Uncharacterized protein n=1 Tax=Cercospora zeae-maydis SCOH1-5 TaxID=717836 RepID=A0A6A6F716_9PEZI|nr:hypothetical protein CERZMDRAFT_91615 [Cercospora zeae-maydis SCOH1-5]